MRNDQTLKLLHAWEASGTVRLDPKIICARCGEPLTRANRWWKCKGPDPDASAGTGDTSTD